MLREAGRHLKNLVAENFAVIFITENFVQGNEDYLLSVRSQKLPAIIPIPSISGSTGLGMRQVRESVRRAVGMDLLSQDEQS